MSALNPSHSKRPFHAAVLAAGKGTRLKSDLPKVLHPLFDKPLLERVLQSLDPLALDSVFLIVGHGKDQVMQALSAYPHAFSMQSVTQEPQLGTGHALMQILPFLPESTPCDVLIACGDAPLVQTETLQKLVQHHHQSHSAISILLADLEHPGSYGRVITQQSQILKIVEAKDAQPEELAVKTINSGIYCLAWEQVAELLNHLTPNNAQGEFYLTDLIALALAQQKTVSGVWLDDANELLGVNSRADLALCHSILNQRTQARLMTAGVSILAPEQTTISPDVSIEPDTVIYPGCVLTGDISIGSHCQLGPHTSLFGKVHIGNHSTILHSVVKDSTIGSSTTVGPFAHLRDGVSLADSVRIGNFVEVKNSRIDSNSNAAHLAYLGDACLGKAVNMGAGSITANYDPIRGSKHQTIIEDGAKVGCNTVLVAPVTVEHDACVAAGSVITHTVPAQSLAIARPKQSIIAGWVARIKKALPT